MNCLKMESYGKVHLRSSLKNEGETSIVDKWLLGLFYMSHILQIIVVEVTSGEFDLPKSCHVSIPSKKASSRKTSHSEHREEEEAKNTWQFIFAKLQEVYATKYERSFFHKKIVLGKGKQK